MRRRFSVRFIKLLGLFAIAAAAGAQTTARFMGRDVVIYGLRRESDSEPAASPAKVCIEGPPQEQCYSTPKDFGWGPAVEVVQFAKDRSALLFSASTGGVSGWGIHYALLAPQGGTDLEDLFLDGVSLSNQNRMAFWSEPDVSDAKIFVTADFVWGQGEGHYGEHRFVISAYLWGNSYYWLADRYFTARWYSEDANDDVLGSEKAEILARL
jgi:hypothetical protein